MTAVAPTATTARATDTLQVGATIAAIQPAVEQIEAVAFAKPRRGVKMQWVEDSPTVHLLVDAENPDVALAKLNGRGNCWYVIGADGERLPGACTAYGIAQGNVRSLANQTLVCPPKQQMCSNPDYIFVQWMRSRVSISSGETITVTTDCVDETMIEIKESIFAFGGPWCWTITARTWPRLDTTNRDKSAPSLASGRSLRHMLQPLVSGIGECWIGLRNFRP